MNLVDRISCVKDKIDSALIQSDRSDSVIIVAATKTQDPETIETCIHNGIVNIGENRVQEADKKFYSVELVKTVDFLPPEADIGQIPEISAFLGQKLTVLPSKTFYSGLNFLI